MISLTCANCKATLQVDDAFAGGVCRCQHCGTIQTVPRPSNRPAAPGMSEAPKALYQVKQRSGSSSNPSGLEELAEVVHSSGLSGSGLINRSGRPNGPPGHSARPTKAKPSPVVLWASVGGVLLLVLLAVIVFLLLGKSSPAPTVAGGGGSSAEVAGPASPAFDGIPLSGGKIIYVIDRGDATSAFFPALKTLTTQSVRSLGDGKRFAVILWNNGGDDAYPRIGTAATTAAEADRLGRWFDDVSTGRTTSVDSAMTTAIGQSPDEIVLLTGKSWQLDDGFASTVLGLRNGKTPKIHTLSLGETTPDDPLKKIALETGGTYKHLSQSDLNNLGG